MADQFDWSLIAAPGKHDTAIKSFLESGGDAKETLDKRATGSRFCDATAETASVALPLRHHLQFVNLHDVLHSPPATPHAEKKVVDNVETSPVVLDSMAHDLPFKNSLDSMRKDPLDITVGLLDVKEATDFAPFPSEEDPLATLEDAPVVSFANDGMLTATNGIQNAGETLKLAAKGGAPFFESSVDNILGKIASTGLLMPSKVSDGGKKSKHQHASAYQFPSRTQGKRPLFVGQKLDLITPAASPELHFSTGSIKSWNQPKSKNLQKKSTSLLLPQSNAAVTSHCQQVEFILPTSQKASSRTVPSHNTRWSDDENALLKEAIHLFGWGKWKSISQHIGTRTPRQVKNHARDWHKKGEIEKTRVIKNTLAAYQPDPKGKKSSGVGAVNGVSGAVENVNSGLKASSVLLEASNGLLESSAAAVAAAAAVNAVPSFSAAAQNLAGFTQFFPQLDSSASGSAVFSPNLGDTLHKSCASVNGDLHGDGNSSINDNGTIGCKRFVPVPHNFVINFGTVQQLERDANPEWFTKEAVACGKPAQYVKIRNMLVHLWQQRFQSVGKLMTKASCHAALKEEGNFNAICRVYNFLEELNLINCFHLAEFPKQVQVRGSALGPADAVSEVNDSLQSLSNSDNSASVDAPRLSDLVQQQISPPLEVEQVSVSYGASSICGANDVVKPTLWTDPAFTVEISPNVIVSLEMHAHLCKNGVMGLLGGRVELPPERQLSSSEGARLGSPPAKLYILDSYAVVPANRAGDRSQDEMNAAEGLKAFQKFDRRNMQVVGWYHAHPYSSALPSRKDIETQLNWQQWYKSQVFMNSYVSVSSEVVSEQVVPFVSVIINPYDHQLDVECLKMSRPLKAVSQLSCTFVRKADSKRGSQCLSPPLQIAPLKSLLVPEEVRDQFADFLKKYSSPETRFDLISKIQPHSELAAYSNAQIHEKEVCIWENRLEKLLAAIEGYIDFHQMGKDDWMAIMTEAYLSS